MCTFSFMSNKNDNGIASSFHLPPLCDVDRLYDPRDFIHKGNSSGNVVEDRHVSDLFPGHRHVFQQLQHCMGHVLEGTVQAKQTYMISYGSDKPS